MSDCLTDCRPDWLRVWNATLHFVLVIPNQETELRTVVAKFFFRCGKEKWLHWVGYTDELHKADTHSPSVLSNHLGWNFVWVEEHKRLRIRRTDMLFNGEWWLAFRLRDWEPVRTVFWVGGVGVWKLLWNLSIKCSNVIRFRLKCYFLKYKVISCCCNQDCENVTLWKLATMAIWNLNKSHKKGVFFSQTKPQITFYGNNLGRRGFLSFLQNLSLLRFSLAVS